MITVGQILLIMGIIPSDTSIGLAGLGTVMIGLSMRLEQAIRRT